MKHPTREECYQILQKCGTPQHVRGHCKAVAATACTIAKALNERGFNLDLRLILAAGLLHDVLRVEDKHWEAGAKLMERLGYDQEADIIRVHMTYSPFSPLSNVTETDMVCLGDRLVKEDEYVGIDERIDYIIEKARRNGNPEVETIILEKKKDTERFIDEIENCIGCSIDELMIGIDIDDIRI